MYEKSWFYKTGEAICSMQCGFLAGCKWKGSWAIRLICAALREIPPNLLEWKLWDFQTNFKIGVDH